MKEKYGPEDIEQLLLDKKFSELLEEERTYVLKHMDGEYEYSRMREILLGFSHEDDLIAPPVDLRSKLLADHEVESAKPRFRIWLNSLFNTMAIPEGWMRPAFQLAGIALLILGSVFIFSELKDDMGQEMLVLEVERPTEKVEAEQRSPDDPSQIIGLEVEDVAQEEGFANPIDYMDSQFSDNNESNRISTQENRINPIDEALEETQLEMDESDDLIEADKSKVSRLAAGEEFFDKKRIEDLEEESYLVIKENDTATSISIDVASAVSHDNVAPAATSIGQASDLTDSSRSRPVSEDLLFALYTAW